LAAADLGPLCSPEFSAFKEETAMATYEQAVDTPAAAASIDAKRRSAIKGAFLTEFIDMFDIYLPVVVLTPVLAYFQPSHIEPGLQAILDSLVFVTTLLGRPVGAFIFGRVADRVGRRTSSIISVVGFGIFTLLIALLPGYQAIGISSYLLLVLLRFLDGICLGGGYTASHPLAMEYSHKSQRGFVGGLIIAAFPAAYVSISVVAMIMFALFPLDGMASPYAMWGWRIPFIIGAVLAGFLADYYWRKVSESELWQVKTKDGAAKAPAARLLGRSNLRSLIQVLIMMTGFWTTQNIITIYMPSTLLAQTLHLSKFELTTTLIITYCALFFSYIAAGMLGQKIGRRRTFIILGVLIATVGVALLYTLANSAGVPLPQIILLVCLLAILVTAPWGVIVAYINERFATDVRATGFGIGFSLSVVLPSFYAIYVNWLGRLVSPHAAPAALLFIGGVIATIGAALGPETKDVDF
jgi:MFS family permease